MATDSGYNNQKKKGIAQFETVQSVGSSKYGKSVASMSLYDKGAEAAIVSVAQILGRDGQVEFWEIEFTAHTAIVGDVFETSGFEFEIVQIVNANKFRILPVSETIPAASQLARVKSWTTSCLGQKAMAASTPVVIASNQSAIPVTGSFTVSSSAGVLDPTNSSTTPLGIGGVFTGAAFEVTGYVAINVNVMSNVASATNGLSVQFSPDGTNWDHSHSTTYTAATGVGYIFNAEYRYARVVYTNGATAQSFFRLQTIFKNTLTNSSLYTLSQTVNSNMFAQLNRSIITGETTAGGGGYVNVKVNPSGALTTESTVTGSVSVTNFPTTQPISGSVSVSNFPATQAVTGTFWQTTQPVSGSVSVSNFPATQAVTGTFWPATQPISATALPLPSGASTLAEQQTQTTAIGSLTETAPATDTASSGLNGRLQRIAQRLTSLIALFPTSIGQKTSAGSLSVVLASDSAPLMASGTITQIQRTVGVTAVRATVSGSAPSATRKKLMIKPSKNNTGSIYFGSSSVTTTNSMEIIGPDRLEFALDASDFYLISDTAGQIVEIVEIN
jgi:hypothetical protein